MKIGFIFGTSWDRTLVGVWRKRNVLLLLFSWLFLSTLGRGGNPERGSVGFREEREDPRQKQLIVGLVDGTVHSVDEETGEVMWSFASGTPLVSSSTDQNGDVLDRDIIVPGVDGTMYLYSETENTYKKLPLSAQEIVSNTPSLANGRNSLILGSRTVKVFALDSRSGKLLKTIADGTSKDAEDGGLLMKKSDGDLEGAVFIGRTEYQVRSVDVITGKELWNVSFSELSQIDRKTDPKGEMLIVGSTEEGLWMDERSHDFFAGYDNTLRKIGRASGRAEWIVKFQAPLASGFSGDEAGHIQRFLPSSKIEDVGSEQEQADQLLVSTMDRQVYALPTKHLVLFEEGREAEETALVSSSKLNEPWECIRNEIVEVGSFDDCIAHPMLPMLPMLPAEASSGPPTESSSGDARPWLWLTISLVLLSVGAGVAALYLARFRPKLGRAIVELQEKTSMPEHEDSPSRDALFQALNTSGSGGVLNRIMNENGSFQVGRMEVGPGILGFGSGGTVVFEGKLDGRRVAIKRVLHQFYGLAKKEIEALIETDESVNVVRCFAMEEDSEFVYLALEKCVGTLATILDPFHADSGSQNVSAKQLDAENAASSLGMSMDSGQTQDEEYPFKLSDLYDSRRRCPTEQCLVAMQSIAAGVAALHARGIVHRDLKPHNVLVTKDGKVKLSDMGLSKMLRDEQSSFENTGTSGSSGWRAPEQILYGRQTKSVDVFSMGCLFFYCMTGGRHPFGARLERDVNIARGNIDLSAVEHLSEVHDLLVHLLAQNPSERPSAETVLLHPIWWTPDIKLQFLCDVSDIVEHQNKVDGTRLLMVLESMSSTAIGSKEWDKRLSLELLENLSQWRKYNYSSVRDLLRVIRNKKNHYQELPEELQKHLGEIPIGYLEYFTSRFPYLLLEMYSFVTENCAEMPIFRKYYDASLSMNGPPFSITIERQGSHMGERGESLLAAPSQPGEEDFPHRPGQPQCTFFLKTGTCKFGRDCRFDHPKEARVKKNSAGLPVRPGAPECQHYVKTGLCKFGAMCKFHHPEI